MTQTASGVVSPPRRDTKWRGFIPDSTPVVLVLVVALAVAAISYHHFLSHPRIRWDGIGHDRSGHYAYALKMATALRQGDVLGFVSELEKGKVWPPLHGLLAMIAVLIGGPHYELAVLPSLLGLVITLVCGFLVASRAPFPWGGGLVAGTLALIFIAGSPAHRIYATDVMLESLGAGLTLFSLYLYGLAARPGTVRWVWRALALALTALFFEKYNYWLLVVLALAAAHFSTGPRRYLQVAVRTMRDLAWRRWAREQARQPLNYIFLGAASFVVYLFARGPATVSLLGHQVSLYPPRNLLTVTYAILFVRAIVAAKRAGSVWIASLDMPARQLLFWHVLPIGASFLLPSRLSAFLWHLSPLNYDETGGRDLPGAAAFYMATLSADYHAGQWSAVLVVFLLIVAVLCARNLCPGTRAVLFLLLIGATLTILHPNQKSRYVHSWIAAVWVGAGIGGARILYHRTLRGVPRLRSCLVGGAVAMLAWGYWAQWAREGHSPEAGHTNREASLLDLTDTYLPHLAESNRTAFLTTVPGESLVQWTYLERYQRREAVELLRWDLAATAEQVRDRFNAWLASTRSDTLVFIDIPPGSYFHTNVGYNDELHGMLPGLLAGQSVFRQRHRWELKQYGCAISLWRRD